MITQDFYDQFFDIRSRINRFRSERDYEYVKTVGMVDRLMKNAAMLASGADPEGRFCWQPGYTVENYLGRARKYTQALERGEFPLKGMFAEPGWGLVDHSFVVKDDRLHIFYNRAEVGFFGVFDQFTDHFGHAVTDDLIHWTIEPPCLSAQHGEYDNCLIWSPGIVHKDGTYYMSYTAVDQKVNQSICIATSQDLYHWTRSEHNPVVKPGSWYPYEKWNGSWLACRDSMIFLDDDGTAYMYYCTEERGEDGRSRPANGISVSRDMLHWEDAGAIHFDICTHSAESPFLIRHDGLYYLFYTNCGRGTAYAVSENPVTGWKDMGMLIERCGYVESTAHVPSCSEVFQFKGNWYISACERQPGTEQYLEIYHLTWNADGSVSVGNRVE